MKALISPGNVALLIALMATLALISPAHAQSASASAGPDDSQYVDCSSGVAVEGCSAATVEDGVKAMGETASQGTAAINDALGSPTTGALASSPPSPGSASASAAPAVSQETAPSDDSTDRNEGTPGIEVLPETGGPSPAMLPAGILLVAFGLTARRASGR